MTTRQERAAELERSTPAAAEILRFYQRIVEFQEGRARHDAEALLRLAARYAPAALAQSAADLLRDRTQWPTLLQREQPDEARAFFANVLLQRRDGHTVTSDVQLTCTCPGCGEPPLLAILRPEGDGGKRFLRCGQCGTEWEFRRLLCPNCGEEDQHKLAVYVAEEFPHIRVEGCDGCKRYLKAIDLTRNGLAVPEVDELASLSLDLWAADKGYTKIRPNLFGI